MTSQQTKKLFLGLSIGALLIAGLYFFLAREVSKSPSIIKPSQLDFTQSNQIQEAQIPASADSTNTAVSETTTATAVPTALSEQEQKLFASFEEILKSKNDNDPRVNQLKGLSADFRKAVIDKYIKLKSEDRNGRGFIVFLIAKEIKSASDLDFLQTVYQEPPCLSLENCSEVSREHNPHNSGVDQTTMNYPQFVALYQIEKQLGAKPDLLKDPALRAGILATLRQAEAFPVTSVSDYAAKIRQKYKL